MRAISDAIREGAEAFLSRQYRTIAMLSVVAAAAIFGFYYVNRDVANIAEMGAGTAWKVTISFIDRGALLGDRRLHRHVRLDPGQHPHRGGGDDQPQPARCRSRCAAARSPGSSVVAMSLLGVGGLFWLFGGMQRLRARPAADRRLRLRRQLRGAVRAARRRHLHQGRGRRRGPRRQGRGGHPGGRPAQPRGDRGPRGRQRRRLRRPRRRPVRDRRPPRTSAR